MNQFEGEFEAKSRTSGRRTRPCRAARMQQVGKCLAEEAGSFQEKHKGETMDKKLLLLVSGLVTLPLAIAYGSIGGGVIGLGCSSRGSWRKA